jgi:hypothetical protein
MSSTKEQAVELLLEIPDNKIDIVVEVLKGLQSLYAKEANTANNAGPAQNALGIFGRYANPKLIPLEKEAWGEAVKGKHAAN